MNRNDAITKAQDLLRKGWCKETYARDKEGREVDPEDAEACRWCAGGAVYRVVDPYGALSVRRAVESTLGVDHQDLALVNDRAASVDEVIEYLETLKEPT